MLLGQVDGLEAQATLGVMVEVVEMVQDGVPAAGGAAAVDIMEAEEVVLRIVVRLVEAEEEAVQVG